jgi:hypothetical protein
MMEGFFKARKACKHWPKRVTGVFLSSMFYANHPKKRDFHHHAAQYAAGIACSISGFIREIRGLRI